MTLWEPEKISAAYLFSLLNDGKGPTLDDSTAVDLEQSGKYHPKLSNEKFQTLAERFNSLNQYFLLCTTGRCGKQIFKFARYNSIVAGSLCQHMEKKHKNMKKSERTFLIFSYWTMRFTGVNGKYRLYDCEYVQLNNNFEYILSTLYTIDDDDDYDDDKENDSDNDDDINDNYSYSCNNKINDYRFEPLFNKECIMIISKLDAFKSKWKSKSRRKSLCQRSMKNKPRINMASSYNYKQNKKQGKIFWSLGANKIVVYGYFRQFNINPTDIGHIVLKYYDGSFIQECLFRIYSDHAFRMIICKYNNILKQNMICRFTFNDCKSMPKKQYSIQIGIIGVKYAPCGESNENENENDSINICENENEKDGNSVNNYYNSQLGLNSSNGEHGPTPATPATPPTPATPALERFCNKFKKLFGNSLDSTRYYSFRSLYYDKELNDFELVCFFLHFEYRGHKYQCTFCSLVNYVLNEEQLYNSSNYSNQYCVNFKSDIKTIVTKTKTKTKTKDSVAIDNDNSNNNSNNNNNNNDNQNDNDSIDSEDEQLYLQFGKSKNYSKRKGNISENLSHDKWQIIGESKDTSKMKFWPKKGLIKLPQGYDYLPAISAVGCDCDDSKSSNNFGGFGFRIACQNVCNWYSSSE